MLPVRGVNSAAIRDVARGVGDEFDGTRVGDATPARYVSSACAVRTRMPDGAPGCGEVPTDTPGGV